MGGWDFSVSISTLTCKEDNILLDTDSEEEKVEDEHERPILPNNFIIPPPEDEYIETLFIKECSFEKEHFDALFCKDSLVSNERSWLTLARTNAIKWILKTRASFNFSMQTGYIAVTYIDRFFMHRRFNEEHPWAVQLLSVACLSLAAKMEECIVPAVSDYQTEGCNFDNNTIRRMELLISSTLEWRMSSVTPFEYLNYFTSKLQLENKLQEILSKSAEFIFAIIGEINLVDHRPSTIAAAAVLASLDQELTKKAVESKLCLLSSTLEPEQVFSCYTVMLQDSHKKLLASDSLVSSELSISFSSINDDSTSFSPSSNKRRKFQLASSH